MKSTLIVTLAVSALTLVALAGCSSTTTAATASTTPSSAASADAPGYPPAHAPASATESAGPDAATASSKLGQIIVDGKGMTVYVFDKDTANSGVSACTGACAATWPAVTATSATPTVTGITGTVATIPGANGTKQITINGLPIYTFAADTKPGDTNGQGVKSIWWVLSPAGAKITTPNAN